MQTRISAVSTQMYTVHILSLLDVVDMKCIWCMYVHVYMYECASVVYFVSEQRML